MAVFKNDVVSVRLNYQEYASVVMESLALAKDIKDREDLHPRSIEEKHRDIQTGKIAFSMVKKWLMIHNKTFKPIGNGRHVLKLYKENGEAIICAIKSSIVVDPPNINAILQNRFTFKKKELEDVNIQVLFWIDSKGSIFKEKHKHDEKSGI